MEVKIMKKIKSAIVGILLVVSMLIVINPISAATVTISPGVEIQAAIDAASPGDTILVNPGTYYGNIIVYKPGLTIKSTGVPRLLL